MTETTPSPLDNVITIDDERIKNHLDRVVRGSVEDTLNALLDAEADRLYGGGGYGGGGSTLLSFNEDYSQISADCRRSDRVNSRAICLKGAI
jgi:hypothetical protein